MLRRSTKAVRVDAQGDDGVPFGRSPIVLIRFTTELPETRDNPRVSAKQAVGTIIAANHGIVTFPKHTRTMDWIDTLVIAEHAIDALLHSWRTGEHVP